MWLQPWERHVGRAAPLKYEHLDIMNPDGARFVSLGVAVKFLSIRGESHSGVKLPPPYPV